MSSITSLIENISGAAGSQARLEALREAGTVLTIGLPPSGASDSLVGALVRCATPAPAAASAEATLLAVRGIATALDFVGSWFFVSDE